VSAAPAYKLFIDDAAFSFVIHLPRRDARRIEAELVSLRNHPHKEADYAQRDSDGHQVMSKIIGAYVMDYWIDEAIKQVNVTHIDAAD
jgi:mRNA-degrading endonuclease RelE of RelBE toxin-antitoxin system